MPKAFVISATLSGSPVMPTMRCETCVDIVLHHLGRVALRVDRDEIGPDVLALVADLLQPAVDLEQRRRADFRAVGEAEEQRRRVAAEGSLGDLGAVLVDQRERPAIGLAAIARLVPLKGDEADRRRHDDEDADEDIAHHGGNSDRECEEALSGSEAPGEPGLGHGEEDGRAVLQPGAERSTGRRRQQRQAAGDRRRSFRAWPIQSISCAASYRAAGAATKGHLAAGRCPAAALATAMAPNPIERRTLQAAFRRFSMRRLLSALVFGAALGFCGPASPSRSARSASTGSATTSSSRRSRTRRSTA